MNIQIKGQEYILSVQQENTFYSILIKKEDKDASRLNFSIKNGTIWLHIIETEPEFQHKGLADFLIEFLETLAELKHISYIEGKFYPKNEFAKSFYLKHNYCIDKDGYETFISKYLKHNKDESKNYQIQKILEII